MGPSPLPLANGPFLAALRRDLSQPGGNILTQEGGIWAALQPRRQSCPRREQLSATCSPAWVKPSFEQKQGGAWPLRIKALSASCPSH